MYNCCKINYKYQYHLLLPQEFKQYNYVTTSEYGTLLRIHVSTQVYASYIICKSWWMKYFSRILVYVINKACSNLMCVRDHECRTLARCSTPTTNRLSDAPLDHSAMAWCNETCKWKHKPPKMRQSTIKIRYSSCSIVTESS